MKNCGNCDGWSSNMNNCMPGYRMCSIKKIPVNKDRMACEDYNNVKCVRTERNMPVIGSEACKDGMCTMNDQMCDGCANPEIDLD